MYLNIRHENNMLDFSLDTDEIKTKEGQRLIKQIKKFIPPSHRVYDAHSKIWSIHRDYWPDFMYHAHTNGVDMSGVCFGQT